MIPLPHPSSNTVFLYPPISVFHSFIYRGTAHIVLIALGLRCIRLVRVCILVPPSSPNRSVFLLLIRAISAYTGAHITISYHTICCSADASHQVHPLVAAVQEQSGRRPAGAGRVPPEPQEVGHPHLPDCHEVDPVQAGLGGQLLGLQRVPA